MFPVSGENRLAETCSGKGTYRIPVKHTTLFENMMLLNAFRRKERILFVFLSDIKPINHGKIYA